MPAWRPVLLLLSFGLAVRPRVGPNFSALTYVSYAVRYMHAVPSSYGLASAEVYTPSIFSPVMCERASHEQNVSIVCRSMNLL